MERVAGDRAEPLGSLHDVGRRDRAAVARDLTECRNDVPGEETHLVKDVRAEDGGVLGARAPVALAVTPQQAQWPDLLLEQALDPLEVRVLPAAMSDDDLDAQALAHGEHAAAIVGVRDRHDGDAGDEGKGRVDAVAVVATAGVADDHGAVRLPRGLFRAHQYRVP